jgi:hypothetical protein
MSHLDWYLHLEERYRQKGYDLGLLICPDPETVVTKIIPKAVEIACRNARKQGRRGSLSRTHWKMHFTQPQLYQISILEASLTHARQSGPLLVSWLTRYIGFLSLCTLQRNSFYVAVGFERILNTGSAKDTLELYEWLFYSLFPDLPPIGRDDKSVNDICSSLHEQIYREFKEGFQTDGERLMFDQVAKGIGGINDEIYQALDKMIPWETDHIPTASQVLAGRYQSLMAEMSLSHICMDQQRCLEDAKRNNGHIRESFDTWRVPIPGDCAPAKPPGTRMPGWPEVEEEIMKEIHWSEERARRGWGAAFEVVVDGEIKDSVSWGATVEIALPPFARYVEIRDADSKAMVANCHLMDPHDLPASGWKSSVRVPAGGRIDFSFRRDQTGAEMAGLSMRVGIDAGRSWSAAIRDWMLPSRKGGSYFWLERFSNSFNVNRLATRALAIAALIAVMLWVAFKASEKIDRLSARLDALQQENESLKQEYAKLHSEMEKETPSSEETRQVAGGDQKALEQKLAQLQGENKALKSEAARSRSIASDLVAFRDTSGMVTINSDGTVGLPDGSRLPVHLSRPVREIATKGVVTMTEPALAALRTLRSDDIRGELRSARVTEKSIPIPRSPVLTAIRSTRPTLRWEAVTGAQQYKVTVAYPREKENGKVIWESGVVTQTQVILPTGELRQGEVYMWQVEALANGSTSLSPAVGFWVVDKGSLRDVQAIEQSYKNSALMLASVYAAHGLYEEAVAQIEKLSYINPTNLFVRDMLRTLRRQLNKE